MARIRSIKPEIRRSLTVSAWPYPVRWTFVGLPGYCDDAGRAIDDSRLVKAELYPIDDDMSAKKIDGHLRTIAQTGPLCRYEVAGVRYLHLTSWGEHQRINRPTPSRIPPCPLHESDVIAQGGLTEDSLSPHAESDAEAREGSLPHVRVEGKGAGSREQGKERGGETPPPPATSDKPAAKRATSAPDDLPITAAMQEWGRVNAPLVSDPVRETAKFLDHHRAKGSTMKDWTAAWRTWMGNAQTYAERDGRGLRVVKSQEHLPESLRFG